LSRKFRWQGGIKTWQNGTEFVVRVNSGLFPTGGLHADKRDDFVVPFGEVAPHHFQRKDAKGQRTQRKIRGRGREKHRIRLIKRLGAESGLACLPYSFVLFFFATLQLCVFARSLACSR
jgi:hypothetical protein